MTIIVKLTQHDPAANYVSFGVPFSRIALPRIEHLSVTDAMGTAIPNVSVVPTLFYRDETGAPLSVQSALIQFPITSLPPSHEVSLHIDTLSHHTHETTIRPFADVSVPTTEQTTVADYSIADANGVYSITHTNERPHVFFEARIPQFIPTFPDGYLAHSGILGDLWSRSDVEGNTNVAGVKFISDQLWNYARASCFDDSGYPYNSDPNHCPDFKNSYEVFLYDRVATLLIAGAHYNDTSFLLHGLKTGWYYAQSIYESGEVKVTGMTLPMQLRGTSNVKLDTYGRTDEKYSHSRGLYAYYALTGDEKARAAITAIGDLWTTAPGATSATLMIRAYRAGRLRSYSGLWTERLLGTALEGQIYAFLLTGDQQYYTAFREVFETAYRHITTTNQDELDAIMSPYKDTTGTVYHFPPQNAWIHNASQASENTAKEPWVSGWMTELCIDPLLHYQSLSGDSRTDEIFVRLVRALRDYGTAYRTRQQHDDRFLSPAVEFVRSGDPTIWRMLEPIYGAAIRWNGSRYRAGGGTDNYHACDATSLVAVGIRALKRRGEFENLGEYAPFSNEGESFVGMHDELAFTAKSAFNYLWRPYRRPDHKFWTSARLGDYVRLGRTPEEHITANKIGWIDYNIGPPSMRMLSWWFNTSLLQYQWLVDAGVTVPVLRAPGLVPVSGNTTGNTTANTTPPTYPQVDWTPMYPVIAADTPLGADILNATANVAGTFVYTPSVGTILPSGPHTLSVEFRPTDNVKYLPVTKTTNVHVQTASELSWNWPDKLFIEGFALTPEHLCATASVPGTFTYDPPLGTFLPYGTHAITATFVPASVYFTGGVLHKTLAVKRLVEVVVPAWLRTSNTVVVIQD